MTRSPASHAPEQSALAGEGIAGSSETGAQSDAGIPAGQRAFSGWAATGLTILALGTVALHIYANTLGTFRDLHMSALHFGLLGCLCALYVPMSRPTSGARSGLVLGVDMGLAVLALGVAGYAIAFEDAYFARGARFIVSDWVAASIAVLLALEFTRRTSGWMIPVLTVIALSYTGLWGQWVGGVFRFPGLTPESLLFRSYFGAEGLFGPIARISWSYVFTFLLFGTFLLRSGAGQVILDLARLASARIAGGPGFVAVFASGLMGSVTGSAVANTVSTGIVTIPLMTRAGFPARTAAGIEAAASTGGQLMPPVMGAGAFIMAGFTNLSYLHIIAAALVPALLYFYSVAVIVRLTARRSGLGIGADEEGPALWPTLAKGRTVLIPLGVLIGLLMAGMTPTYAGGLATLAVILASWLTPTPMGPRAIAEAALIAIRVMIPTAMLLVSVGLIVMVIGTTGLGNTLSLMITTWAGGSLLATLVLVALASLVLGMGLPVTASYIVLATLSAPALYGLMVDGELVRLIASGELSETLRALLMISVPDSAAALGSTMSPADAKQLLAQVPQDLLPQIREQALDPARAAALLLSAHMIVFWLSQDSNVTPPVSLAAFAAAGIAGTPPMATGVTAWRIAKGLYVIPVLLAFTPLIGGSGWQIAAIAVSAAIGLYALGAALEGWMEGPLPIWARILSAGAGVALLWPGLAITASLVAAAVVFTLLALSRWSRVPGSRPTPAFAPGRNGGS